MNDKKAQLGIGTFLLVFVGVVVGVAFFITIAQTTGIATSTVVFANESLGVASNSTTVTFTQWQSIGDVVVTNASTGASIPSTNYTVTNNVITDGALSVTVLPQSPLSLGFTGHEWEISGTAENIGYISDSGARSMTNIIPIFFALLIALIAILPVAQSKLLEMMGR